MTLTEHLHGKCSTCRTVARLHLIDGLPYCIECRYLTPEARQRRAKAPAADLSGDYGEER